MAVTFEKISYDKIELGLKDILNDDFSNVYISPVFTMIGNECIRINLESSENLETTNLGERRMYAVTIRFYAKGDLSNELEIKRIKGRIDRIKKCICDNKVKSGNTDGATNFWIDSSVETITYNVLDSENEDLKDIYIGEFDVTLINYNVFT